jgi:hypothetical protein
MELTKEDWYLIIENYLSKYGQKYDELKILAINNDGDTVRVNYNTNTGDWCSSFGHYDVKKSKIPKLIRESKINKILSK